MPFILDQHDSGYWMARWHKDTWPIGRSKLIAQQVIDRLNMAHRPSLEVRNGALEVCWNEHEKGQPCEYEILVVDAFGTSPTNEGEDD